MGGGALGSKVSRLVGKEVSKRFRNFTLAPLGRGQGEGLANQIAESLQEDPFCTKSIDFGKRRQVRDDICLYNFTKPCHRALIARSIAKSIQVETNKKLDCHVAGAPRNDKTPTHPNLVLDLLHAHRVSLFALTCISLNLFAIRTRFALSVRKFAPLKREGNVRHAELVSASHNDTLFLQKKNPSQPSLRKGRREAFTLAEVLITLGIIGVVAALTLPSVISKYNGYVTANKLRQVYSVLKQAESMAVNEYGDINTWDLLYTYNIASKYYYPYLKTNHCHYRATIKSSKGVMYRNITNDKEYVCIQDGVVIFSTTNPNGYLGTMVYVDLNGMKGPNVIGRDVFTFLINRPVFKSNDYNTSSYRVVPKCPVGISTCFAGPYHVEKGNFWEGDTETLIKYCAEGSGSIYTNQQEGTSCAYMIEQAGWKIPKNYPIKF